MSVYKNCFLYRSGEEIIIDINGNPDYAKRVKESELGYTLDGEKNLVSVQDKEGNYYYLDESCQRIQQ